MKKIALHTFLILFVYISFSGCKSKEESSNEDMIGFQIEETETPGVQRMQAYRSEVPVHFKGQKYNVLIGREADESLLKIKSLSGTTYLDNKIILTIKKEDGSVLVNKTFTKNNFTSVVPSDFLSKSILEGFVFEKTVSEGFVFAVSVSYPQTDLYIPISLTLSLDGKMSMKKEELMEDIYEDVE